MYFTIFRHYEKYGYLKNMDHCLSLVLLFISLAYIICLRHDFVPLKRHEIVAMMCLLHHPGVLWHELENDAPRRGGYPRRFLVQPHEIDMVSTGDLPWSSMT